MHDGIVLVAGTGTSGGDLAVIVVHASETLNVNTYMQHQKKK